MDSLYLQHSVICLDNPVELTQLFMWEFCVGLISKGIQINLYLFNIIVVWLVFYCIYIYLIKHAVTGTM